MKQHNKHNNTHQSNHTTRLLWRIGAIAALGAAAALPCMRSRRAR
jgi:hypothetical protein